jgi:hypothetical protein
MSPIEVGDEVRVFDVNSPAQRRNEPDPGVPGEVVHVARTLVTITSHNYGTMKFRLDTQRVNDNYGHQWFRTPEQVAEDQRVRAGLAALKAAGFEVRTGYRPSGALIVALAEAARDFPEQED